jgi:hypothetical protein
LIDFAWIFSIEETQFLCNFSQSNGICLEPAQGPIPAKNVPYPTVPILSFPKITPVQQSSHQTSTQPTHPVANPPMQPQAQPHPQPQPSVPTPVVGAPVSNQPPVQKPITTPQSAPMTHTQRKFEFDSI